MKIVVAGGTGFVGEPLVRRLLARGDDVAVLTRNPSKVRAGRPLPWEEAGEAASADVVINLAGENVGGGRWTEARKKRIIESRVDATNALVEAVNSRPDPRRTFINASAVGYYGLRGDETLDETSAPGEGFLAEVVKRWEELARRAEGAARVVILRFGVVLGPGGALGKMLLPFKLGLGGPIGSGLQWMSWVDRDDVLRMIEWAIDRQSASGIYNVTAPSPVTNREFTRALGRAIHRPAIMPIPAFALRIALGEMADEILLGGQRIVPARAAAEGFTFAYPELDAALRHAVSSAT
ncbi:MAG: TIGR01777 family oxidoreductase [Acidobacteriota bacterium]